MALDDNVKRAIEENRGFVVILAGSDSDRPHVDKISGALSGYGIPHQVRICSAHKQPDELMGIIREYDQVRGALGYIAVAGGTDALSGTISFRSMRPVVSCPPDAPNNSCLTNPPGSSNAYVANPKNAARFFAQAFSELPGTPYADMLLHDIRTKLQSLGQKDAELGKYPYTPAEVKK